MYVCTCVRCVMRGGGGRGGGQCRPLSKSNLLILSWRGGAQPIMNDQATVLVVPKFNTRGLAIKLSILISLLCMVHRKKHKKQ